MSLRFCARRKQSAASERRRRHDEVERPSQEVTTEKVCQEIWKVFEEYEYIFPSDLPKGLPPKRLGHGVKIDLEFDTKLVHRPIYKLSPPKLEEAKRQIEYVLEHGFIRHSESPWGAPMLFAPKKDGGLGF